MNAKVLAVISARGGSKEIPGKNLRILGEHPLISYVLKKSKKSKYIDKVICSTDSEQIAEIAKENGAEIPFIRPENLSGDRVPLISATQHAMFEMDRIGYKADIIVQIAPTCPFIKTKNIDKSIEYVMGDRCDSAVSLKKIEHEHP